MITIVNDCFTLKDRWTSIKEGKLIGTFAIRKRQAEEDSKTNCEDSERGAKNEWNKIETKYRRMKR
jgi:hypothetical protein